MPDTATVTVYDGGSKLEITGRIHKRYAKGLTVEDTRGVIYYATMDRVTEAAAQVINTRGEFLW